ncbi:MAG: carbohydrate binding domain-containing protein [Kiritimatiellae bacterium]|nr:carbohydrate binding domain-containing protein [Kiritimatiellia bacterium]
MQWSRGTAIKGAAALLCLTVTTLRGAERFPFVIPGDDATPSVTDMSGLNRKPAGADGFVSIRDGRFHTDGGRLRIWGMNLCFGANFPEHEEAEKIAAHLAKLGINGMRIHHHDGYSKTDGIWGEVVDGKRLLDPGQLDRQDYFLDQLIRHGIYINLNLHVSRFPTPDEGFPGLDKVPRERRMQTGKCLLYFEPRMQALFKAFCRMYLTHQNPYRKLRRVDDPGIAMIEILNENAFSKAGPGRAASLPEPYRGEFKRQWNAWLKKRYHTTAGLRAAWADSSEPLGPDIAEMGDLGVRLGPWRLHVDGKYPAQPVFGLPGPNPGTAAVKLDILKKSPGATKQELVLPDLPVEEGRLYTLSFWVKADAPRSVYVDVSNQGPDDWEEVGCKQTVRASGEWKEVVRAFRATQSVPNNTRICFKLGGSDVDVYLAGVRLQRGGRLQALPEGQTLEQGNVEIPGGEWIDAAKEDAKRFMFETERGFVAEMVRFLREDLGVKVPITASQTGYHAPGILAQTCDYADTHAYWQHPAGTRRWAGEWTIGNTPMESMPGGQTPYLKAATSRLLDRPFTLSECNIANPGDYGASIAPVLAMIAALQDWDGVFFFTYQEHRGRWFTDRIGRFFAFNGQPVKLAMLTACANLYRRGDLQPLAQTAAGTIDDAPSAALALSRAVGIDPKARAPRAAALAASTKRLESPDGAVVWDAADPRKACIQVNAPASRAVWGLIAGQRFELGGFRIAVGDLERDYAAVVITSLDARPLEASTRMLLAAAGSAENIGMGWNAERTSVGNEWGTGPAQVNGVPARITLKNRVRAVYALDGRGARLGQVDVQAGPGTAEFAIGPEHRTLWYEIVAE